MQTNLEGFVDNFVYTHLDAVNTRLLLTEMVNLSAFRHAPLILKQRLRPSDGSFANVTYGLTYTFDDFAFYQRLRTTRLSTQNNYNMYVMYHLTGSHQGSLLIDENVNRMSDVPQYRQAAGALRIVAEYLSQMRNLGIYDNSNIIIMTDHGYGLEPNAAFMMKRAHDRHWTMPVSNAPISHEDLWPTLVQVMGLDTMEFAGRYVFSVAEDEVRERVFTSLVNYPNMPNTRLTYNALIISRFTGHALDYSRIRGSRRLSPYFQERYPHRNIVPLYDSFYGGGWE